MSKRIIKFRAWDEGKMYYEPTYIVNAHFAANRREVLMEFTGRKDKSGREIYESDIIMGDSFDGSRIEGEPIIWAHSGWYAGYITNEGTIDEVTKITSLDAISNIEIIGNIYENPRLTK